MKSLLSVVFFDAPVVLDASVTPIPKASDPPLQVIANIGLKGAVEIEFIDTTNEMIGVYTGSVGNERLVTVVGNGLSGRALGKFAAGSRVSLRSMGSSDITVGQITGKLVRV